MHSTMTSLVVTCLAVALLHSVTSAPVSKPMTSEDGLRLTEMITRLNNTLSELSAVLHSSSSSNAQQLPVEDFSSELPAAVNKLGEELASISHDTSSSHSQEVETAEADEDGDDSDSLSLREVMQYLVQLKHQQHQQQKPSAVKRDHDIPFPLDDSYPSYNFRD